jgi:hypothetical protein
MPGPLRARPIPLRESRVTDGRRLSGMPKFRELSIVPSVSCGLSVRQPEDKAAGRRP